MQKEKGSGGRPAESVAFRSLRRLGCLGDPSRSTTKEVHLGTWYGEMCVDIRRWKDGKLLTGINLTRDELSDLREILNGLDFGRE